MIVTRTVPTLIEPWREAPVFSATVKFTLPGPVIEVADVTVKNPSVVLTFQVQPPCAETKMVFEPPLGPTSIVVWGTVRTHAADGAVGELFLLQAVAATTATITAILRMALRGRIW